MCAVLGFNRSDLTIMLGALSNEHSKFRDRAISWGKLGNLEEMEKCEKEMQKRERLMAYIHSKT